MTIETKYNIGDKVFLLYNNEIKEEYITEIGIYCSKTTNQYISYVLSKFETEIPECKLFSSKEELINSL